VSPDIEYQPASRWDDEALAALFNRGYVDYQVPLTLDAVSLRGHIALNDVDLGASRVAVRDGEPLAFALLGVRDAAAPGGGRGWIGGMGVAPEARGAGLGTAITEATLAEARRLRLGVVDLEVLEQNLHAARIYEALGFRDTRRLEVWGRDAGPLPPAEAGLPQAVALPVAECLEALAADTRERPAWQCDLPTLAHASGRLSALGVRGGDGVAACVLFRPSEKQVRIASLWGRPGAGAGPLEAALRAVLAAHPDASLTILNLPADNPGSGPLLRVGAGVRLRQREMRLALEEQP